jgi:circadian clock protein KaiB
VSSPPPSGGSWQDADVFDLPSYRLRLYVSGPTPLSARAVVNARRAFDQHLAGRYELEIIDIADNVAAAIGDQVVAAPTLVKLAPLPVRRLIGDMSTVERLLKVLDVALPTPESGPATSARGADTSPP